MAEKEDFSYAIFSHLGSVSHPIMLVSFPYVTKQEMLIQVFYVLE